MTLQKEKSFRILSLEAKDIYYAQQCDGGYSLPPKEEKGRYFFQFKNILDWSLDSEELQKRYAERERRFSFKDDGGTAYTLSVINVKFSLACNQYNKYSIDRKTVYIKDGRAKEECDFSSTNHGVDEDSGELLAIRLNVEEEEPLSDEILSPYFAYDDKAKCYVRTKKTIKHTVDLQQLRKDLYENGFRCEGKEYVRYKRSSGSSREGNCLFIEKDFAPYMKKWSACGLSYDKKNHDKASWEAYRALSLSSSVGMFTLPIKNILFVEEYEHSFQEMAMFVGGENGLESRCDEVKIENKIWDGESLLDESVFLGIENQTISEKSMLLLRNRFFKTCAFRTKLQKWFKDNQATIETVKKYGVTLADRIEDIMMVTTTSSLKYLTFLDESLSEENIQKWADKAGNTFSIVKYDKKTHFFNGDLVQSSYQLLNTLPLTDDDAKSIVDENERYLRCIQKDEPALMYHLLEAFKGETWDVGDDGEKEEVETKIEIFLRVLSLNNDFAKTRIFKDFKQSLMRAFRENLKGGHFLFKGTNATLFGNGAELLQATIGLFDRENPRSVLQKGEISCTKFAHGQELLGARSPHVTMGNLLRAKNTLHYDLAQYFVLSDEIVCVNAIGENIQERLNGCDYDSDVMLLTDDPLLVERATEIYADFLVPVNKVHKDKLLGQKDEDVDSKISINKIGEIVNFSQKLNSLYWDLISKGERKETQAIYRDICKLAALSGMEIDRAKRKYKVDATKELRALTGKYKPLFEEKKKPEFFKTIDKKNSAKYAKRKKDVEYTPYATAMDRLWELVAKIDLRKGRDVLGECMLVDLLEKPNIAHNDYKLKDKIINEVKELYAEISGLRRIKRFAEGDEKFIVAEEIAQKIECCKQSVLRHCKTEGTVYLTAQEVDNEKYTDIASLLFEVLFAVENEKAYSLLKKNGGIKQKIIRDENGALNFFGLNHSLIDKKAAKNC